MIVSQELVNKEKAARCWEQHTTIVTDVYFRINSV
jgi:hypothetical protein